MCHHSSGRVIVSPDDRDRVVRSVVVVCADWPLVAAGTAPGDIAVVMGGGRVLAASPAARAEGIEIGHRRREAQRRCPAVLVHHADADRDARLFHAVGAALEHVTPRIELSVPGVAAFPTRGPSRYFGGDQALAAEVARSVGRIMEGLGWPDSVGVGVADGRFAAQQVAEQLADRMHGPGGVTVLDPGTSAAFLAPLSVRVLGREELVEVLLRLGITTLGAFAALPAADVAARFGPDGLTAHRLAGGLDEQAPRVAPLPPHLMVTTELDPPLQRVDQATFVAKGLVEQLHARLAAEGLSCTRVCIAVETENGESNERVWRQGDALGVGALIDRVRWQLDGWLNGPAVLRPTSGICRLSLIPDEVGPARGRQLGFWGGETAADARAMRALARVQGVVGAGAVMVPELRGGRSPAERIVRMPMATTAPDSTRPLPVTDGPPWPGRVPTPSPTLLVDEPVRVCDELGAILVVSGRGALSAPPAIIGCPGRAPMSVVAWAGPWLSDERWWDPTTHVRRARLQLLLDDGRAVLVACEHGDWSIEGWYD